MLNFVFSSPRTESASLIDILTCVGSLIALLISIVAIIVSYKQAQKSKTIELESHYFIAIFSDFLLRKIPEARMKINMKENNLFDIDEFVDTLNLMRHEALYFQYADKSFYDKLKEKLQDVEDYIVLALNRQYDKEKFITFENGLTRKLVEVYQLIDSRYHGKTIM